MIQRGLVAGKAENDRGDGLAADYEHLVLLTRNGCPDCQQPRVETDAGYLAYERRRSALETASSPRPPPPPSQRNLRSPDPAGCLAQADGNIVQRTIVVFPMGHWYNACMEWNREHTAKSFLALVSGLFGSAALWVAGLIVLKGPWRGPASVLGDASGALIAFIAFGAVYCMKCTVEKKVCFALNLAVLLFGIATLWEAACFRVPFGWAFICMMAAGAIRFAYCLRYEL